MKKKKQFLNFFSFLTLIQMTTKKRRNKITSSFDSFPVNSAPLQNVREKFLFFWKVILFLWCTQVKQKVAEIEISLLFIQVMRGVDNQENGGQPECSSNPHHCNPSLANRAFSPGGHKKKPNPTEQSRATRRRPPSPHKQGQKELRGHCREYQ